MGCGVFLHKYDKRPGLFCKLSGRDLKAKYDEIRGLGCKICGRVPLEDQEGCEVKIDYVHGCKVENGKIF